MPRSLPGVDADGRVENVDEEEYASGALLGLRHGGTSVVYRLSPEDAMAVCATSRGRVLLGYSLQTRRDRRRNALAMAVLHGFLAAFAGLMLAMLLFRRGDGMTALALVLAPGAGFAVRAAWLELRAPGKVWEATQWLDLDRRTWRARKIHPDGSCPAFTCDIPLDALALVCFVHQWENSDTHDVGLCEVGELARTDGSEAAMLNLLHSFANDSEATNFARAVAAAWGIDAWREVVGRGRTQDSTGSRYVPAQGLAG